jgi:hypothetical protein
MKTVQKIRHTSSPLSIYASKQTATLKWGEEASVQCMLHQIMMAAKLETWSKVEVCGVMRFLHADRLTPTAICSKLVAVYVKT